MEHKNKEKLDWIIASNIDKGINLQTVYGTYLEIRELLQKKINECRKKDVVHYKDAFFEFQDQKIQATVIFETYHIFFTAEELTNIQNSEPWASYFLKCSQQYAGCVWNRKTNQYDMLFVTEFSHLLADERAVEKAAMLPDVYDISDRKIKSRTVTTIAHNWEELIDVTLLRKQMLELMKRPDISEQLVQKYLKKVIIHIQSTDVRPEITGWYPDIDAYFSETNQIYTMIQNYWNCPGSRWNSSLCQIKITGMLRDRFLTVSFIIFENKHSISRHKRTEERSV